MKVLYPIVKAGSGSDVYYERLNEIMNRLGVESKIINYQPRWGIFTKALPPEIYASYDIIHSNAGAKLVFIGRKKPLIVTVHLVISAPLKQKYLSPLHKLYYMDVFKEIKKSVLRADFVLTVSKHIEKEVRRLFGISNLQTIWNGINTDEFKPMKINHDPYPGKIKLLFVGNLTTRKGVDLLPKIIGKLDNKFLLFYTTGLRTKKKVFKDKRMLPLSRRLPSELIEMYNLCDILIMPSRLEGFGYSALEAMACAKPVVATNCSSLPELVDDGEGGFLCEMDNVEDFVDKIKILAGDKELRARMGKYNREKVEREFNLLKMGKEYEKVYKRFI